MTRLAMASEHAARFKAHAITLMEHRWEQCPQPLSWSTYSATAALALAGMEGATAIDVYGADWTDQPDWDGINLPENRRDDDRWKAERVIWANVCAWLERQGIQTTRKQFNGTT